jgi:hypothetical protein
MQNYLQTTEVPTISLWFGAAFGVIVAGAMFTCGYLLGKDCYRPLRDYRGRFLKRVGK